MLFCRLNKCFVHGCCTWWYETRSYYFLQLVADSHKYNNSNVITIMMTTTTITIIKIRWKQLKAFLCICTRAYFWKQRCHDKWRSLPPYARLTMLTYRYYFWRVLVQFLFSIMQGCKINEQEHSFKDYLNIYIIRRQFSVFWTTSLSCVLWKIKDY